MMAGGIPMEDGPMLEEVHVSVAPIHSAVRRTRLLDPVTRRYTDNAMHDDRR